MINPERGKKKGIENDFSLYEKNALVYHNIKVNLTWELKVEAFVT